MAKSDCDLIGIRGRVRDLVFKKTKFGTTVSEFNADVYKHKKWTDKQRHARVKFAGLCKLAQVFRKANDVGFKSEMKYLSQPCFVRHNFTAVEVGVDEVMVVDYEKICMSNGTLPTLSNVDLKTADGRVDVVWQCGAGVSGDGFDWVTMMLYCPDFKNGGVNQLMGDSEMLEHKVRRSAGRLEMLIPERWKGLKVYSYVFAFDNDGRSSNSQFVRAFEADYKDVERKFEIKDETKNEAIFVGVEQRNEIIDGRLKNCFVIKFRDDDELIEEILAEPTDDSDFEVKVVNGVRQPSRIELVMKRMRDLIRDVNPTLFEDKYMKGEEFRANSWKELCEMVTRAVSGG